MRSHTGICWAFVVGLVFATSACGQAADSPTIEGDPIDGSFLVGNGAGDQLAPEENSAEARAILDVVNTYSLHGLVRDASLYYRGARSVIEHRNGPDGIRNTDDDLYLRSMKELDDVPYIGKLSMKRLRDYVRDQGMIANFAVDYSDKIPAKMTTIKGAAFKGTIGTRQLIRVPVEGKLGDRIILWLRKANQTQWNPKVKIVDDLTGKTVEWANPWGNSDARLPYDATEAARGWEIDREPADYTVVLDNTGTVDGDFEFTMDCVGGPCYAAKSQATQQVLNGDFGDLRDDALRQQMVARHELTHIYLSYYDARRIMFSDLDNHDGYVTGVYTGQKVKTDTIPDNSEMNAEHTWPQSKGAVDGAARSDLHHLFPVISVVNSLRNSYPYCNVVTVIHQIGEAKYGDDADGNRCFEPRDQHKGDAARAMFYFAAVYEQHIDDTQEAVLRQWAQQDPVDGAERGRNDRIEQIQGSRNFFVDDPALIDRISNF